MTSAICCGSYPSTYQDGYKLTIQAVSFPQWCASYDCLTEVDGHSQSFGNNPEDAACKLAIELFKQGILVKEAA
jgi:hypothetical protein